MMRREYHDKLDGLKKKVLMMGGLAKQAAENSIKALVNQDMKLASKIIKDNAVLDDLEFEIENECIKLIALQQPVAKDLREIVTYLKVITDMDRVSDLAGNIAEVVLKIADEPFVKPLIDIPRMSEISQDMLADCLEAISSLKVENLLDFSKRDDVVDALLDQVRRELITIMVENPRSIRNASHLLFVALHLERVADHACNIASRVVYMVTGRRIKLE